ncbi:MAG TPA: outer membrane lipoprotein carrier protein LolA [Edaphobacter sp.]|nr:outer membrane lipoprotein carrier protein LolA [Edaphobacter sp.]
MLRRILLLIVLCSGSSLAFAQVQDSDALIRRVDEHYNHLTSLRARYTEHYAGMGLDRTESGTLLLKKPGRMRWSYDQPAGKLFILDGKFAWFYTPGDSQAQRIPAKQLDDLRSPLRFLLGHTQLKKELVNLTVTQDANGIHIAGIPQGMEQRIHRLTLDVTPAGAIQHMKLEEIDGAITEFAFTQLVENVPTREADFVFIPPDGVTIVDALPPV